MKRSVIRFISTGLVFVILISSLFSIISNADYSTSPRPSMIKEHFSNLDNVSNASPNMNGTCAFVALSMLLSYYDAYWNDNIVPETLDWEPGEYIYFDDLLIKTFNSNEESEIWDTYSNDVYRFIQEQNDNYLQPYLMNMTLNNMGELIIYPLGVLAIQTKALLERYLVEERGFNDLQITVHYYYAGTETDTLISIAKSQIENGNPVIFSGLEIDLDNNVVDGDGMEWVAHSMIGYDVIKDSDNRDDIVLNLGWSDNSYQTIRTTEFRYNQSIIWIEINEENLPHVCSDAYRISGTDSYLCSCEIYGTHPVHKHGQTIPSFNSFNTSSHCSTCTWCNQEYYKSHSYDYLMYSTLQHRAICDCGYEKYEPHVIPSSLYPVKMCLKCGMTIGSPGGGGMQIESVGSVTYISETGSYVRTDGIIVLSDEDTEMFLNGELDIDEMIRNSNNISK